MKNNSEKDDLAEKAPAIAGVVERNIKQLIELSKQEEKEKTREEHIADTIARFTSKMAFIYVHFAVIILWITWNTGALGIKPIDPSFVAMSTFASVEAIFLTAFVLISQNRMDVLANKRSNLDLQVSLLSEHELTKMMTLVAAIARKLEIEEANNPEIEELAKDVHPENVLESMETHNNQVKEQTKN